MKSVHVISILALFALLSASCNKMQEESPVNGSEIRVSATEQGEFSKGVKVDLNDLKTSGFIVYANVCQGEDEKFTPLMNNQQVSYVGSDWMYLPTKYWPTDADSYVNFYPAYTDGSSNVRILYDWYNMPQTTFYVNNIVSKQTDMLWASPILKAKQADYAGAAVNFNFKHALTGFFFRIKLANDPKGKVVKVNSLTLTGFFAPKAYVLPDQTDMKKAYSLQGDWRDRSYTINADGDNEIDTAASTGPLTTTPVNLSGTKGYFFVLPFDYQEYTVTLAYQVSNDTSTTSHSTSYTVKDVALEAGTIINTLLVLNVEDMGSTPLTATASVHDWVEVIAEQEELFIE